MLEETGERLSSKVHSKIMVEHIHRYAFASTVVAGKTVLDIACGEGYGSNLLSKTALQVYGVDQSAEAVAHASATYPSANIQFLAGDVTKIPLPDFSMDVVISFETIEHLHAHEAMIRECKRVLKKDGVFIISTPDKHFYTDVTGYKNPYHVKELYEADFVQLVRGHFERIELFRQGIAKGGIIYSQTADSRPLTFYQGDYYAVELLEQINVPEYMIIIATNDSNMPIYMGNSFFESDVIDAKLIRELNKYRGKYEALVASQTFKAFYIISKPFQWLKARLFK